MQCIRLHIGCNRERRRVRSIRRGLVWINSVLALSRGGRLRPSDTAQEAMGSLHCILHTHRNKSQYLRNHVTLRTFVVIGWRTFDNQRECEIIVMLSYWKAFAAVRQ